MEGRHRTSPAAFLYQSHGPARAADRSMAGFRFHGWLIVEIFTDTGHSGIGNAALAPRITKQVVDLYLKPILLGRDPWDIEASVAADVSEYDSIRTKGHRHGSDQRRGYRAVGRARKGVGKAAVQACSEDARRRRSRYTRAGCTASRSMRSPRKPRRIKTKGYQAP